MAYARTRKHYRVAEKEMEMPSEEGIFITDEAKNKLIIMTVILMVMIFIKGMLVGILVSRDCCDD